MYGHLGKLKYCRMTVTLQMVFVVELFFFFAAWYEFFVESAIVLFVILGGGVHKSQLQLQFKDYAPCYLITANNRYPETNT